MNEWIYLLGIILIIFVSGKWIYDTFGNSVLQKFGLPDVNNKNGLQASAVNRTSATQ